MVRSRGNGLRSAKLLKQFNFGTANGRSLYPAFVLLDTDQLRLFTLYYIAFAGTKSHGSRCNLRFAQE
jgi:hypothetical protein